MWVLVQDLGFLGGLGTDPNSMIPFILLAVSGYLAYVRAPAPAPELANAASTEPARARPQFIALSIWSLTALAGAGLIALGAIPMALAQASPNADPLLAEAISGQPTPVNYAAPQFSLADQSGRAVTLASLRGQVVLLGFIDPARASQCQPIGREFELADSMLGPGAARVALVGIDLPQTRRSAADLLAYDDQAGLSALSNWRFLTGTPAQLRRVRLAYGPERNGVVFVIGPGGRVRDRLSISASPGTAATESSFAVLLADAARQLLASP